MHYNSTEGTNMKQKLHSMKAWGEKDVMLREINIYRDINPIL